MRAAFAERRWWPLWPGGQRPTALFALPTKLPQNWPHPINLPQNCSLPSAEMPPPNPPPQTCPRTLHCLPQICSPLQKCPQALYYLPQLRAAAAAHLCDREICLLCELNFLFHMIELCSPGSTCQPTNLLRSLRQARALPSCSGLVLLLTCPAADWSCSGLVMLRTCPAPDLSCCGLVMLRTGHAPDWSCCGLVLF